MVDGIADHSQLTQILTLNFTTMLLGILVFISFAISTLEEICGKRK